MVLLGELTIWIQLSSFWVSQTPDIKCFVPIATPPMTDFYGFCCTRQSVFCQAWSTLLS